MKIIATIFAALLICLAVLFVLLGGPWSFSQARNFRRAVNSGDQLAIARAAVTTIRKSGTNTTFYREASLTNLPGVIAGLKPSKVWVRPDGMTIEFHGGFDHFGFEIREQEDVWELTRYTERGRQQILTLRKDERTGE